MYVCKPNWKVIKRYVSFKQFVAPYTYVARAWMAMSTAKRQLRLFSESTRQLAAWEHAEKQSIDF